MRRPKLQEYETRLTDLEREYGNIRTNLERSVGLEEDITALEAGLASIKSRLMNASQVASNYEFFYDLERRAGVNVRQFSQGVPSNGAAVLIGQEPLRHFSVLPYDVTMSGSLEQILTFLDHLDRQEFIVRMDLLNITAPAAADAKVNPLNARLRCHVLASLNE